MMRKAPSKSRGKRLISREDNAPPRQHIPTAELPFRVLFRSNRLLVIDKPAGLPVHPSRTSSGPSVEDWFPLMSRRSDGPWLVHRLDQDTAGCLAIALRKQALIGLQAGMSDGAVHKTYWAVVQGRPAGDSGEVNAPLLRTEQGRRWRMSVSPKGESARTRWRVKGHCAKRNLSWLELELLTGRTHQIRVHCAFLGVPVYGDSVYGDQTGTAPIHLLAQRWSAVDGETSIDAVAPVPEHMQAAMRACGWSERDSVETDGPPLTVQGK